MLPGCSQNYTDGHGLKTTDMLCHQQVKITFCHSAAQIPR